MDKQTITSTIKKKALELGFSACGCAPAKPLKQYETFFKFWLSKGLQASMQYMENYVEKRLDPTLLVPGAKSIVSVLLNYFPEKSQPDNVPLVAKYAYGHDYHFVIKKKLKQLLSFINSELTECNGRYFTDSAPVLERAWAVEAGLGWIGKNTNLIAPKKGSYFFIGELIIDLELEYDRPVGDFCGTCTRCIDACPTKALFQPYTLDSKKCISYQTIENKGEIDKVVKPELNNYIFGCDICQDVCPWNRFSEPATELALQPHEGFMGLGTESWQTMDEELFRQLFSHTPLSRVGFKGIRKNLAALF
ncbi:MAG: tRNA epoxyqueuosine(34) reductase QueG [Bacteroidales bacterium]|nr:tRNA epoxyqueuosine(34) reductase QueG [Bacteroidales bacterium]